MCYKLPRPFVLRFTAFDQIGPCRLLSLGNGACNGPEPHTLLPCCTPARLQERALRDAPVDKAAVQEVVLVGGCSRIPRVHTLLQDFFGGGVALSQALHPEEAVACGAALLVGAALPWPEAAAMRGRSHGAMLPLSTGALPSGRAPLLLRHAMLGDAEKGKGSERGRALAPGLPAATSCKAICLCNFCRPRPNGAVPPCRLPYRAGTSQGSCATCCCWTSLPTPWAWRRREVSGSWVQCGGGAAGHALCSACLHAACQHACQQPLDLAAVEAMERWLALPCRRHDRAHAAQHHHPYQEGVCVHHLL